MKWNSVFILLLVFFSWSCNQEESVSPVSPDTGSSGGTILITFPNGGEVLTAGTTRVIRWTANNSSNVNIEFTADGGQKWVMIAGGVPNAGFYSWTPIPDSISNNCLIRITDAANGRITDISDNFFSIIPNRPKNINITSPVAGDTLFIGKSHTIRWTSSNIQNVKIQYSVNNGASWSNIIASVPADSQKYVWSPIPDVTSMQCKIRITDVQEDSIAAETSGNFGIISSQSINVIAPAGGEVLTIGTSYEIKWNSIDVANVKLEYSTNNGNSWITIASSTPSDGSYIWNVPNLQTVFGLVRISDALDNNPSALTNGNFTIAVLPSITVTSPDGGEVLRAGESKVITWTSTGSAKKVTTATEDEELSGAVKAPQSIQNVRIEYSTNSGATWTTITASTTNNGSFNWSPIPSIATTQGRIRISDAADGDPADISDGDFTIQVPEPKVITVTSPNGGESWEGGSTKNITWTSTAVSNVKIEYSTNNGATYTTIVNSFNALAGLYIWSDIPNTPSNLCLVKISDASDNQVFDLSNSTFTITQPQSVRVVAPNGGEKLSSGGTFNIQWTSQNLASVKIEYTTNNGFEWYTVVSSTESDGFYTWNPVPNVLSTNCKVRISDAADGYPTDASDSVFSILVEPTLKVIYPNGSERIAAGSSVDITWTTTSFTRPGRSRKTRSGAVGEVLFSNVKIELSTDGGTVWTTIIASTNNNGLYNWSPVPTVNSANCKIRISDTEDGIPTDVSDSTFAIVSESTQSIQLTAPNGGESFTVGGSTGITWTSTGIGNVNIEFTTNNGVSWNTIVNGTESDGYYLWSPIPNVSSTNCKVRVSDAVDSLPFDISDATFSIFPNPALTVIAPNGGESYTTGTQQNIQWTSQNIVAVKIELTTNNGASWSVITDSTESDGIYLWTVPNVNSALCRVRISSLPGNLVNDVSDNNFAISNIQPQSLSVTQPNGGELWLAGTIQPIKWVSSGVDSVKIEYTTNNGVNWNLIVNGTESDGFYNWTIPNINSANVKVRILDYADGFPSDESDNLFSINTEDRITVISPNGGERILSGTSQAITWSTSNLVESGKEGINSVKIELSTDGGLNFQVITSNAPNTGAYVWNPVPNVSSSLCRIRVSDSEDGIPSDLSDSNFVIFNQVTQEITVTSPNGGEQLSAGGSTSITWTSIGVTSVNIEFTTNNGVNWVTIVNSTESDGYYLWTPVPNVSSTNCRIKISDAVDSIPFDESNNTFTILPLPAITVLSPNGGESFTSGTQQNITWTSQSIAAVKIEFTINNGASWTTVADSTESDGIYVWTVPNLNSSLCRIRISDYPGNTVSDISDNNFVITNAQPQSITLLQPNGGENWYSGTIQPIRWISNGIDSVKLEYSTNNGLNWITIINGTESDGFYNWTIPNANTSNAVVRVSDYSDGTPSDRSDAVFSLLTETTLRVTSPNGGERILSGTAHTITWTTSNLVESGKESITNVKIELSTDGGLTFSTIVNSTLNTGSYNWSPVPNVSSSLCRIKISDAQNGIPSDLSDSNFVIYNQPVQEITVSYPNGGEQFNAGNSIGITWTSSGVSTVTILFTTNNGVNWSNIVTGTESDGYYLWSPVPNVSSTNCRVRIVDAVDSLPYDESNSTFTVLPQPGVRVIAPNGGESLTSGNSYNITWQSANVSNVKIEFTSNNGAAWSTVVATTPSTGVYSWTVPNIASTLCKIRVSDADATNNLPSDESDNTFEISSAVTSSIVVTAPAGGEIWASGSSQNIEWTSSGVTDVKIEFTTDNGQSWTQIVQSTPSDGFYQWNPVANVTSSSCKIRISDAADGFPYGLSAGLFTIIPPAAVTVISPNGGEYWQSGNTYEITWVAENLANVQIDYSTNNGSSWSTVVSNTANTGNYSWTVPVLGTTSTQSKIRISDPADGQPFDISDGVFTLSPNAQKRITVVTPNGGEQISAGSNYAITWTSAGVSVVDIDYTTNNGVTWTSLAANEASDGYYLWQVGASLSGSNFKIRISDDVNPDINDLSDNVFSIISTPSLTLLTPNGGESLTAGNSYNITWLSANVANVKIEFTSNNGATWNNVVASVVSSGVYSWTVPNVSSTLCKIRISDADATNGLPFDISENSFQISSAVSSSIVVTAPAGGEIWASGSSQNIEWTSSGVTDVKIEFSTDNGQSWNLIEQTTPSDGFYQWNPVPNVTSSSCKIRISDAADGYPFALSSGLFTIVPLAAVTVITPNGGEYWETGSTYEIRWVAQNLANVQIDYSTNNGATWLSVTASTANTGNYSWTVPPGLNSTQSKIRVSDPDDGQPFDISDSVFTISPVPQQSLTVITPNGGEIWGSGTSQNIIWTGTGVVNVKIEYSTNNGQSWTTIIASTVSNGFYQWNPVPSVTSTNYIVRISDAADGIPFDVSDNVFTIVPVAEVTVTAPNGGELWTTGTTQNITWVASNLENVKLELTTNNGSSWTTIIASTPNVGTYLWTVPNLNSNLCKVRVSDADDGQPFDVSDSAFIISNQVQQSLTVLSPNGGEDWEATTTQTIRWLSSAVSNVKIEYTTNNGIAWTTIAASTPSDGLHEWSPTIPSALYKIRISDASDGFPMDESDAVFTVSLAKTLTITYPNGGEVLTAGNVYDITWTSQGISHVMIEYKTVNEPGDSGWTTITNRTPSDGSYSWGPTVPSTSYRLRMRNADASSPMDESDGLFTVEPQPTITVVSPNGGDTIQAGTSYNIRWSSVSVQDVKIELTTNNGANWQVIVASTESDGIYTWSIPGTINSSLCKVRISDLDGSPSDVSDAAFVIYNVIPQSITVTSPNGGEILPVGTSYNITWISTGVDSVKIEFSTNNGQNWSTITGSTVSNGFYQWNPVPSVTSTNCRVRISNTQNGFPYDISDNEFTISPEPDITVISPNGGEVWTFGSTQSITWEAVNLEKVKIEFTTNNGATWSTIVDSTDNTGSYLWTIPNINSSLCRVRISDSRDGLPFDLSDNVFALSNQIQQSIQLTAPNGGESWEATSSRNITWISSAIQKVKIEFTTNNGLTWTTIADSTESDGLYEWNPIPNTPSGLCKIRISDYLDGIPNDESDAVFTITQTRSLQVVYPNGGESLISGTVYNILWNSQGVTSVKIEYRLSNVSEWTEIISSTPSDGSYEWSPSIPSTQYKIRISNADGTIPVDESDATFTVEAEPSITVTSPNGGESLQAGSSHNITWSSNGFTAVKIELTTNNGATWFSIVDSTETDGTYTWAVDSVNSGLCKIRISDEADGLPSDISDNPFTIYTTAPEQITIIRPVGGEDFPIGSRQEIKWSSQGVSNVKIEYSTNSGVNWTTIVASTPSSGSYLWNPVPNAYSANARIRISDASDGFPYSVSPSNFTISAEPALQVLAPNGFENFISGTSQQIRWSSTNVAYVRIEYSSNNGSTWVSVTDSTPSTGIYEWTNIPVANSDLCRVRVSDGVDGVPFDVSDTTFSIVQSKALRVIFPNGPTVTPTGTIPCNVTTDTTIIWYSVGITNVDIEYTLDNGASGWTTIVSNTPSTGAFYWTIPAAYSSLARIRVTDTSDPTITDMSDGLFNLGFTPPGAFINIQNGKVLESGATEEIHMILSEDMLNSALEYSDDSGVTWKLIEKLKYTLPGIKIYNWNKPAGLNNTEVMFRLKSELSDKNFVSEKVLVK